MRNGLVPVLMLVITGLSYGQIYQGPASGSVESGITITTSEFSIDRLPENVLPPSKGKGSSDDKVNLKRSQQLFDLEANNFRGSRQRVNSIQMAENLNFEGPNAVGCWVADSNITPGPEDVLIAINTTFWITDRSGNLIKQVDINNWFADFIGSGLVFDPKSFYDTRTKRFYLSYLYFDRSSQTTLFLISVSDDSTAEGDWNTWALPADLHGMDQVSLWADFPSMIITDDALYIAVDMFSYTSSNPVYSKLRVVQLNDLLQEEPGEVRYTDIWNFKNPMVGNSTIRTVKLVHDFDFTGRAYLTGFRVSAQPESLVHIFEISDIFENLSVQAYPITTSEFSLTPNMTQKGGGKPMQLFHLFYSEMFRRDDTIYIAHSSKDGLVASIHYMEVDTESWTLRDEIFMGNDGYHYGYPDLIVDEQQNVFMVYNRTSSDEYPGVYYSAKAAGAANFGDDIPLMEGLGNMNIFCAGNSNPYLRFSDYSDIMFDPVDPSQIWLMGEYIGPDNRWKTRIGKVTVEQVISHVDSEEETISSFRLSPNYPNPFNPTTTITFSIPDNAHVVLKIYNAIGQEVTILLNQPFAAGEHRITFDAGKLPTGTYYYELRSGSFVAAKKMVVVK